MKRDADTICRRITAGARLTWRAIRYRYRNDPGGITFLLSAVVKGDTVFDIGAHKGGYLYYLIRKCGKSGKVVAFEPQTSLFSYLNHLKKRFGWNNVTIENIALSNSKCKVKLYIPTGKKMRADSPGASLLPHLSAEGTEAIEEVETLTLDEYCRENDCRPVFLKIDVEGNELKIIEGGLATIRETMPVMLMEIEARHIGREQVYHTLDVMDNLGYRGFFIQGRKRVPVSGFDIDIHQDPATSRPYCNNFVFIPASSETVNRS